MDSDGAQIQSRYTIWLIVASLFGGLIGAMVQVFTGTLLWWMLPVLCLTAGAVALGGDNIVGSAVLIVILVPAIFWVTYRGWAAAMIGPHGWWAVFASIATSKLMFACSKDGLFRNRRF